MQIRLSFSMQTKLSPSMVIAGRLLQATRLDLEQLVQQELADNPALELAADPLAGRRATGRQRARQQATETLEQVAARPSAIEQVAAQIRLQTSGRDMDLALSLLAALDERGYLTSNPADLAAEWDVSPADLERARQLLLQLDPPGIGALDLRECLLCQCDQISGPAIGRQVACLILADAWDEFVNRHYNRLAKKLGLSAQAVEAAQDFITRNLYPYPLQLLEPPQADAVILQQADLVIYAGPPDGVSGYRLAIPAQDTLSLHISPSFAPTPQASPAAAMSAAEKMWLDEHVERARLFIAALNQRWSTLRLIGHYLIDHQRSFLVHGPRALQPLTRATIAADLGLHESTISRAVSDKIVQLPDGRLMPLSNFFDRTQAAKAAIHHILKQASRPLSDSELTEQLRLEGLNLARRTVAKYRQQINIPSVYYRSLPESRQVAERI